MTETRSTELNEQLRQAEKQRIPKRQTPFSKAFVEFIPTDWAPYPDELPEPLSSAPSATAHRDALAARFDSDRLVIPAGHLMRRNNDCDYPFRPNTAFAYYSGLGTDREPNAVLVVDTTAETRDVLYFKPRAPRTDREFYADPTYGEMWVGQRESLEEMAAMTGLVCRDISQLDDALSTGDATVRVIRDADETVTATVDSLRPRGSEDADDEFYEFSSAARFCKDDWEVEQLRDACRKSKVGFESMIAEIPEAVRKGRGERWMEGTFGRVARHLGNEVGYGSICAAGDHANTLHWVRNDGDLRPGELILIDAGIEVDSLYTADITRTLPISGTPTRCTGYATTATCAPANLSLSTLGSRSTPFTPPTSPAPYRSREPSLPPSVASTRPSLRLRTRQLPSRKLATTMPRSIRPPFASSASICTSGASFQSASRSRCPPKAGSTAGGWFTARRTTSV